ncbi:Beta-arrestin [Fasciola gigantica]|uniref:Beta-arrestin n=1 Tax=Fasciola gigantica TaxID=46835 RepID=A0A504YYJ5_FASGI|nr:Beta-arrestin [Fasciola gigantica]
MSSSKRSPKQSPQKGGKNSPSKKSSKFTAEDQAACERFFARRRYEDMEAVFKQRGPVITIYARSIHLYEVWNCLPPYEQFNCSASPKKSPKSEKKSPKKSPKGGASKSPGAVEESAKPEFEPAVITGIVCIHKSHLGPGKKLFAEVTAEFRYYGHSKVPPYPDNVIARCQCFRDIQHIYPVTFDEEKDVSNFNQQLIYKLRRDLGNGYRFIQYVFDVTRKPDSLFFTRPYYPDFSSGLFWKLRVYIAPEEGCDPLPGQETVMEFFKYTICPALTPFCLRETEPVTYKRYCTQDDTGDLILEAQLDRDIYYHGQEIKVKINIENNSGRHLIDTIAVFVEQTYRLFHQFPHDNSIRLNEVLIQTGDPANAVFESQFLVIIFIPVYPHTQKQARRFSHSVNVTCRCTNWPCNFVKKPGNTYYVYQRPDGSNYLSLLSPEEWGPSCPNIYLGAYKLMADMTWKSEDQLLEWNRTVKLVKQLMSTPSFPPIDSEENV